MQYCLETSNLTNCIDVQKSDSLRQSDVHCYHERSLLHHVSSTSYGFWPKQTPVGKIYHTTVIHCHIKLSLTQHQHAYVCNHSNANVNNKTLGGCIGDKHS